MYNMSEEKIRIQSFFLLQAASLAPDLEKLVRATTTLVYDYMKERKK